MKGQAFVLNALRQQISQYYRISNMTLYRSIPVTCVEGWARLALVTYHSESRSRLYHLSSQYSTQDVQDGPNPYLPVSCFSR